ncbi:U3 small nucleolar RNA-associated protein 6 homolog [Drosophila grimshawi]|uniref:GH17712 n=1 Tax=Drosophila grimshawi TaxID=7222 RepID=B4JWQ6_DROGR|nr:U3 small nucleolar RNA-associated protein 6 homolog [Drosophila grimshawi]EDV95182.1 GH17712 [Drosophila grimshawi]
MGEFIAEMQERMLPEYEQMKQYQVFTPDQIRECVRKRERLLLNITKSQIRMGDYLEFILYEKTMYKAITEKEKLGGLKLNGLKASICTRVIRMYREMLVKFAHEKSLWDNYIKFSKKSAPQEVAGIYEKMLSYHGDDPQVWLNAALWIYEYNRANIARVQDILLRGLQRHACSEPLNSCFFEIQLKEAAQADSERNLGENTVSEQQIQMERVMAVYRNSLANITNLDYFLKLLESCEDHSELTAELQYNIINELQTKFPREPALWDALAKRELRGFHLGDLTEKFDNADSDKPSAKKSSPDTERVFQTRSKKRCIELCVTIYKVAVQHLQTQEMLSLYLDVMMSLGKNYKSERTFVQQFLANALQDGHASKLMHARHYAALSNMLGSSEDGAETCVRILTEALQHDNSLRMHELLLATLIRNDSEASIQKLFSEVRRTMGAEARPLWEMVIGYYRARGDQLAKRQLNDIYMQACKETWPEFVNLRCNYLSYLWHEHSPAKAREEYAKLAQQPPLSLKLHREMVNLIQSSKPKDLTTIKAWRMCYEFMITFFGKREPSVWIEYIKFERDHGDPKSIPLLSRRAIATLEPQFVSIFQAERAMEHVGMSLNKYFN